MSFEDVYPAMDLLKQVTQSLSSNVRQTRNYSISAEKDLNTCSNNRSISPPPLSHCTSSSSPPVSPLPSLQVRVPGSVQTGGKCTSRQLLVQMTGSPTQTRQSPTFFNKTKPPIVSPSMPHSPSKSWDEGDDRPTKSRARLNQLTHHIASRVPHYQPLLLTQVQSDLTGNSFIRPRHSMRSNYGDNTSFVEVNNYDVETRSFGSQPDHVAAVDSVKQTSGMACHSADMRPPTPTNAAGTSGTSLTLRTTADDDVSSLGGVEDCASASSSSLMRIITAIKCNLNRPSSLSVEEKYLWDVVQSTKQQAQMDVMASICCPNGTVDCISHNNTDNICKNDEVGLLHHTQINPLLSTDTYISESRCQEAQNLALKQQEENSRSLMDIQRVLANVQAERDKAVEELLDFKLNTSSQAIETASGGVGNVYTHAKKEDMIDTLNQDLVLVSNSADHIKFEKKILKDQMENNEYESPIREDNSVDTHQKLSILEQTNQRLALELESKNTELQRLLFGTNCNSIELGDGLRKELAVKSSALENAKMIITSLENASNTVAADLRAKLRCKDDECNRLKKQLSERQKTLDALATELRDLQRSKSNNSSELCEVERVHRLSLSKRLERNMCEIRAASVVLEATQDPAAVHCIGELLVDSVHALTDGIDVITNHCDDERNIDFTSDTYLNDSSSVLHSTSDYRKVHKELQEKIYFTKQLEDSVRKYKDELKRLKGHVDEIRRQRDDEVNSLRTEVKILRQQCSTNMEILTRKERELAVLRDSLQVEDVNVGYISDDNSDCDDEENDNPPISSVSLDGGRYGASQAEALVALLAQGGNRSFDSGSCCAIRTQIECLNVELVRARTEQEKAARELKVEKESLSNAKMIISSLERANKSMMEDLRSRLQDSNSAIANLLEKSIESEKTSSRLRAELSEALERERDRHYEDHTNSHALMVLPIETID